MTKKIIVSFLSGLAILVITWIYQNYDFSLSVEDGFFKKVIQLKSKLIKPVPGKNASIIFINTGKDPALVDDTTEYGQVAVSDRVKIYQLLLLINNSIQKPAFTVLDIQFYYPYTPDPKIDSLLQQEIAGNERLMIPLVKDDGGNYKKPLFPSLYAYSDYQTFGSSFNKFRILNHSPISSIPIVLHEKLNQAVYKDYWFFATCNGKLCLSALWPEYYLKEAEVRDPSKKSNNQFYNLGELLLLAEGDSASFSGLFEQKLIMIGNFEMDSHSTPAGKMAGPVLLANIYLSLLNNQHIINYGFLVTLLLAFSVLSYTAWFSKIPLIKIPVKFIFSSYLQKFIKSYVSYFGSMFFLSLICVFLFNNQVALFLPSLILSGIEYIRQKKYLPEKTIEHPK